MTDLPLGWNPDCNNGGGYYEHAESRRRRQAFLERLPPRLGVVLAAGWCRRMQPDFDHLYPPGRTLFGLAIEYAERYGSGAEGDPNYAYELAAEIRQMARDVRHGLGEDVFSQVVTDSLHTANHTLRATYRQQSRDIVSQSLAIEPAKSLADAADDAADAIIGSFLMVMTREYRPAVSRNTWQWLWRTYTHACGSSRFEPAWRTTTAVLLARGIVEDRAYDRTPILADALQDAGCDSEEILKHLQGGHDEWTGADWVLQNLTRPETCPTLFGRHTGG